jgi:hypothetical protein
MLCCKSFDIMGSGAGSDSWCIVRELIGHAAVRLAGLAAGAGTPPCTPRGTAVMFEGEEKVKLSSRVLHVVLPAIVVSMRGPRNLQLHRARRQAAGFCTACREPSVLNNVK